ncbi:hypothetical protein [Chitinophaga ginsengisoli]|uniref:Peptidase M54-like protein n=1 Tax=Chitinophaga ginsengisoli TaxID=363837 RepID=A0A2P8FIB6_9BACT|nr:hypothetical protein [Chitinophaga ginsengisoli]PSL21468.1 peptidase M54-like protein [Chitinophaga ginsengisoli]
MQFTEKGLPRQINFPEGNIMAGLPRLKNKENFYKLVIHELGHNMGLQHCPVPTCYMRDAKGGDPTGEEKAFCKKCAAYLQKKGWKL